ncbi:MAG: helix-turn-helix transcriptional regulator [Pirellulaceae bacterium]
MLEFVQLPWVCRRLGLARETLQLTLASVGEQMGVQRAFISNLEHCRKEPKLSTLIRYADILEIDLATLFKGCPATDGTKKHPSMNECRNILKRLGITSQHSKLLFARWTHYSIPPKDSDWGILDELIWLDLLVVLDGKKWGELAAKQAIVRLPMEG